MQSTPERRLAIREYLSAERQATIKDLMSRFHVSKSTIRRDLDYLETEMYVPLLRERGNAGGIAVTAGWYSSQTYLRDDQEEFLRGLIPGLQTADQAKMKEILSMFARPKTKVS